MKTNNLPAYAGLALALIVGAAHPAHAELLAADGFDYPAGTIATEGGSGWLAGSIWDGTAPVSIAGTPDTRYKPVEAQSSLRQQSEGALGGGAVHAQFGFETQDPRHFALPTAPRQLGIPMF